MHCHRFTEFNYGNARPDPIPHIATGIDQTIQTLAATPTGRQGRVSGTYEKVVPGLPYIIAYALGDEPKTHETLTILRIIHSARDRREESWPE